MRQPNLAQYHLELVNEINPACHKQLRKQLCALESLKELFGAALVRLGLTAHCFAKSCIVQHGRSVWKPKRDQICKKDLTLTKVETVALPICVRGSARGCSCD